jgi:hypothetical protein
VSRRQQNRMALAAATTPNSSITVGAFQGDNS